VTRVLNWLVIHTHVAPGLEDRGGSHEAGSDPPNAKETEQAMPILGITFTPTDTGSWLLLDASFFSLRQAPRTCVSPRLLSNFDELVPEYRLERRY
jgi:hypothetical protein